MRINLPGTWRRGRAATVRNIQAGQRQRRVPTVNLLEDRTLLSGFLGSNYLVAGEVNTLSDVSAANATPASLHTGDVVFGYQQLGQINNTANGTANFPQGAVWVVFSFTVDTITPGTGAATGLTFVHFKPTDASNALSLQQLVPNLYAQTGLGSSAPVIALEANSAPDGTNLQPSVLANSTMVGAMATFNTLGGGMSPQLATEFAFGQVPANGDFLTVYGALALTSLPVQEAGGATVLFTTDAYAGFGALPNINPDDGAAFNLTSEVTISGQVFQQPGVGGAPPSTTGANATDHATYALMPQKPAPGIHIVKYVNGQDAGNPPGVQVAAGSTLTFTYVVTNTGNEPLDNVSLVDDKLGAITSFTGDTNSNGKLDTTETWTYTTTAIAQVGQVTNTGTVTGTGDISGGNVTDNNPANYFGAQPGIHIVKYVNGQDADNPPGVQVAAGSTLTFTYVVTNTGNEPLDNVSLVDDKLGAITSFTGDTNSNGKLDTTETWTYTTTAIAQVGQVTNTGTVTGTGDISGGNVTDNNPANYFGIAQPSIITTPGQTTTTGGGVFAGEFATIGFWHNQNGQAVITSFNGGSTQTLLGNWLTMNFPHLFGASNPYTGTSLAGLTNAQVATVYASLWTPSGLQKNTYVQAFAVALGLYADTTSLGGQSLINNGLAAKYGFVVTASGAGTFNVGSNGAAFGVSNGTPLPVTQILQIADSNFSPATGLFYFGSQSLTSALNNVLDGINSVGDIPGSGSGLGGGGSTAVTLTDSATLSGGSSPTGTITFYLMGPGATASTPLAQAIFTDTVTISGDGTYTTSQGTSTGSAVPMQSGTYQWVVVYSGDPINSPVTSPFGSEPWNVGSAAPTINTIDGGAVVLGTGTKLTDSAQLAGGSSPTGTITFYLFAPGVTPNAANSNNVYSDTVTISGNGTYTTATGTNPGGYLPTVTGTYQWVAVYSGDPNNAPVASAFGDEPETVSTSNAVGGGAFATIGFWHNKNGQAVITSFNGDSTQTLLGNWLATNFPHLFGTSNPYTGTSLAGLTNAQVAAVYQNPWTPSGVTKNTYVQAFAVALGMYADTGNLGYNSTAAKYGFKQISGGGGSLTYNVGSNGAAFGGTNGATFTILQILQMVDSNFDPSTGNFYGGDQTKTTDANNVLNGINTAGDITLVTTDSGISIGNAPLVGNGFGLDLGTLFVYVDNSLGNVTADEQARIDDAIADYNTELASVGTALVEVGVNQALNADITIQIADTTDIGGVAQGVLGLTEMGGQVTLVQGWNYYLGTDPAVVGADQYDFETVVAHELGHAMGLGHSADTTSVMYPTLGTGVARRDLTAGDLTLIDNDTNPEPLLAAPRPARPALPLESSLASRDGQMDVLTVGHSAFALQVNSAAGQPAQEALVASAGPAMVLRGSEAGVPNLAFSTIQAQEVRHGDYLFGKLGQEKSRSDWTVARVMNKSDTGVLATGPLDLLAYASPGEGSWADVSTTGQAAVEHPAHASGTEASARVESRNGDLARSASKEMAMHALTVQDHPGAELASEGVGTVTERAGGFGLATLALLAGWFRPSRPQTSERRAPALKERRAE